MKQSIIFEKQIAFNCSPAILWDLLTNPLQTKQYMFGCEILSDWKIGSPVLWRAKTETGEDIIHVKGEVKYFTAGEKVSFTMLDPNMGLKDIPENYVHLTYEVSGSASESILNLTQDFTGTENAQKRYAESEAGWDMVIELMKKLVE